VPVKKNRNDNQDVGFKLMYADHCMPVICPEPGYRGQFLIVDKPYKNMLNRLNGETASEKKGFVRRVGVKLHYRAGALKGQDR
jgi:hypothetical protein